MATEVFYKYRSLDNWKFALDIIVHSRLHAAPFQSLNDPMEGHYFFFGDTVAKSFKKAIYKSKQRRNICSLSRERLSTLLWSYYAAGHTGVAFGVLIPSVEDGQNVEIRPVRYDNGLSIGKKELRLNPDAVALNILTQKQLAWQHEKEVRVFAPTSFVPVKLTELVLGCNISPMDQKLITAVARRWHPRIKVKKLDRSSLDHPEAI
jgi:hypothetical protein